MQRLDFFRLFFSCAALLVRVVSPSFWRGALQSITLLLCCSTLGVYAASIEVVEAEPESVKGAGVSYSTAAPGQAQNNSVVYQTTAAATAPPGSNVSAELYIQLQALQTEVQSLRGIVEQQAYEIEQLSQRRMDDYLNLDQRIGELRSQLSSGTAAAPAKKSTSHAKPKPRTTGSKTVAPIIAKPAASQVAPSRSSVVPKPAKAAVAKSAKQAEQAKIAYRNAYQHVKQRQFDEAKVSLVAFIGNYSQSQYVPNAYFWLGELYYLDSNLKESRNAFSSMINDYPSHRKVPDAKFKLGKIYHQLGDNEQAKKMLESVLADHPNSKAANPSSEYLKNSLR